MAALDNRRVESGTVPANSSIEGIESDCWEDPCGALTISTVGPKGDRHYRLRMGQEVVVDVLAGGRIVNRSSPTVPQSTIDHFLADQVAPRVIADSGQLVIHAAAIRVADEAILIAGVSGRGKSTLSASFDRAGFALMGDDAMVVSTSGERPQARPVYPSLRLFPDSLAALLPGQKSTEVAHYSPKQRIDVPMAAANSTPLPIRAIFVIAEPSDAIRIARLSAADACIALVESSFALDPVDTDRASQRLGQCSALANAVPAFELAYPRDYERLSEVRRAILDHAGDSAR